MKLTTKIVKSIETLHIRKQMFQLYQQYYQIDETAFLERFESNQYYALYKVNGELVGFTGLRTKELETAKGKVMCIYVGQSCILAPYRNKALIPRTCVELVAKSFLRNPFRPIYLWCDSLTYKPYLAFVKATTYTYPTRKKETPQHIQNMINELGQYYYGKRFNPATGTVKKDINIVNDPSAIITEKDRQQPDIDFYASMNPNYLEANGLITVTHASIGNFMHCAIRCLKKQLKFWKAKGGLAADWLTLSHR